MRSFPGNSAPNQTIPDGFSLEISALAKQPSNVTFFYDATYTNGADYFNVRAWLGCGAN
jgi:hypothetical protein